MGKYNGFPRPGQVPYKFPKDLYFTNKYMVNKNQRISIQSGDTKFSMILHG